MHSYFARRYSDAVQELGESFELDAGSVTGRVFLGLTLVELERFDEAIRELDVTRQLSNGHEVIAALGYAYARAGHVDAARARLAELLEASERRYLSPSLLAQVYAALGETTTALDWLEKASDVRAPDLAWMRVRPVFDSLRAEGRFAALTGRLAL
jgi:tetratricopeptide (TPR) repeat protein